MLHARAKVSPRPRHSLEAPNAGAVVIQVPDHFSENEGLIAVAYAAGSLVQQGLGKKEGPGPMIQAD